MPASDALRVVGDSAPMSLHPSGLNARTVSTVYQVYGVTVAVRATSAWNWDRVLSALPLYPGTAPIASPQFEYAVIWGQSQPDSATPPVHILSRNGELVYRTHDADTLIHALQVDVVRSIAVASAEHIFVHAGAVTYEGRGILLPGVPGAGKSTLVSYLIGRGAQYYSDEYAVIDRSGRLHPFPCRLRLGATRESKQPYTYGELGATAGQGPAQVACIVFPTFDADAPLTVEAMSTSSAALHLLEHMPAARARPKEALMAAVQATSDAWCGRFRYGRCEDAATVLFSTVGSIASSRRSERREGNTP